MAEHIQSVAGSAIAKVSKAEFYRHCRSGDMIFLAGAAPVSRIIEDATDSPWSHVATIWLPPDGDVWLTLEATFTKGVHVGLLSYYADGGDGDVVLARRPTLSVAQQRAIHNRMLGVLGDGYDWEQEIEFAASKFLPGLPVRPEHRALYCSAYEWYGSLASTATALQHPEKCSPTPEDVWTDRSVVAICALVH